MITPDLHATTPTMDPKAIETYIELVFGYLEGLVPIRAFSETGTPVQTPVTEFVPPQEAAKRICILAPHAADRQRGLYVVPATVTHAGKARAQDIVQTGVLLIDLDSGNIAGKRDHLIRHVGTPALVVASGGVTQDGQEKLHVYWRLNEPAQGSDLPKVAALRAALARKVGGDASFGSLQQPIRVPGTVHGKNGQKAPVRLIEQTCLEYDLDDLAEAINAMPAFEQAGTPCPGLAMERPHPGARELATRKIRANGADGITRFQALSTVIGHWIRNVRHGHCSKDEAWEAVVGYNAAMIVPPWTETRLTREFDGLLKRDINNHGSIPAERGGTGGEATAAPNLSDDALADALVTVHRANWRHTAAWGQWYRWDGCLWARDDVGRIRELARQTARNAAPSLDKPAEARRVASHKTISATVAIAACDPRVATRTAEWDAHPMLLNTPAGVVDLETGEMLRHDPQLLLTQMTNASPGTGCPLWTHFLDDVTDGDSDLQAYLQRLCGYALTGDISEQVFVFFHGNGANGKSVFLSILSEILGNYAATATQATFMASTHERHLTEMAGLRAARLVTVPETERGRAWAEARIKSVTGGEKIRANFMRQDHFEFTPQFKLIVAGNHRPDIGEVGEAMRRRLHLVPFEVTIPAERRDRDLTRKLRAEANGILGWMIEGCADWRRIGLAPPARIRDASEAYIAEEDLVGQWIEQCCDVRPGASQATRDLFANWSAFARETGVDQWSQKAFGEALRQRGFKPCKIAGTRAWKGLALRYSREPETP